MCINIILLTDRCIDRQQMMFYVDYVIKPWAHSCGTPIPCTTEAIYGFPPWVDNRYGLFVVFNHDDQLHDIIWSGTSFTTFYQYLWYLMRRHIFAIRNNWISLATTTETTVLKVTKFFQVMGKFYIRLLSNRRGLHIIFIYVNYKLQLYTNIS